MACKLRATREIQLQVLASLHNFEQFFTLFHTLPLHDSHLNTGLLIAKIQANLAQNKANKMVDKIQPYTMHEELNQFVRNDVWELVPRPKNVHVIGTKWIFKNKTDEDGEIIWNKSWLVA